MLRLTRRARSDAEARTTLTLPYEARVKGRLRVTLDDGTAAGLFLERGGTLRDGDCLASADGVVVRISAAPETVSSVRCDDPHLLSRACYHLGNRHVPVQIEPNRLRYPHDRVLDEMLRGLGLEVSVGQAPFEPEPGAYDGHAGHAHADRPSDERGRGHVQ